MDKIIALLVAAIVQGTPLLYGATGEIITEKSGNLNLGIPGIMYVGAISGVIGGSLYQNSGNVVPILAILIPLMCSLIGSLFVTLIYCFLTVTLRANQNVTGLALTTFGIGLGNYFGGQLAAGSTFISLRSIADAFNTSITSYSPAKPVFWDIFFSHGFMVYLAIIIAIVASLILNRTRVGLRLRAVGESPATSDAAGINVTKYKYLATCIGGMIAGLGGLYFIMGYSSGIWSNDGFGDRGWLAIAIVIFATWKPKFAIPASYLFGGLYVLYTYIGVPMTVQPLFQMLPYAVTIIVLIIVSVRKKKENQPPTSLGLPYFREDR